MKHGSGSAKGPGHGGHPADLAQIGAIFNDATSLLVGGITDQNRGRVMQDLLATQSKLQTLIDQHPNQFVGVAGIHAQEVVDQINLETQAIASLGTDPTAAKYINDVQRDIIDIVQGDPTLSAMAQAHGGNGFAPVPDLLAAPAQFHGNQEQTDFMRQFAADAIAIGDKAVTLAQSNASPAERAALIQEIQAFDSNANEFTLAQGGVYSARFNNEFADNGVNGTASRALIHGLETNDIGEVRAAAEVLAANAQDVAGNMLGIGQPAVGTEPRIPDHVDSLAEAGAVFNDATTQLVGGVWSGNRAAILEDLQATQTFLQQLVAADPGTFHGAAAAHANRVVEKLGQEIAAVNAAGIDPNANQTIHDIHSQIIQIVQHDATLRQAATTADANGFSALPAPTLPAGVPVANNGHGHGHGSDHAPPASVAFDDPHQQHDAIAQAFAAHGGHHWG